MNTNITTNIFVFRGKERVRTVELDYLLLINFFYEGGGGGRGRSATQQGIQIITAFIYSILSKSNQPVIPCFLIVDIISWLYGLLSDQFSRSLKN